MNLDFITNGQYSGAVAHRIMNGGMSSDKMRPWINPKDGRTYISVHTGGDRKDPKNWKNLQINADGTLRRDEWKQLDAAVLGIAETRLVGINDLVSKGLVYNLGNGMGTTVLESHDISDALEAELTMDAVSRAKGDRQVFGTTYLPIPIIHADYEINSRVLEASRNMGNPIDTTMAERAARKVAEKLEAMLFTETTYTYGGGTIYSYIKHPHRNIGNLTAAWDASGVTGADIIEDVRKMKQDAINDKHYGPFMLYIPTAYETILDTDYNATTPGTTIRERILKIANIMEVKVVDTLPADNVLLVQMTSDVVRLVRGMGIQNVQWQTEGNFINKYKVLTIQVPQIRSDHNQTSGIVHYTTASLN